MAKFCDFCGIETEHVVELVKSMRNVGSAANLFESDKLHDVSVVFVGVNEVCPECAALDGAEVPADIRDKVEYYTSLMAHSVDQHRPAGSVSVPEAKQPSERERVPDILVEVLNEILDEIDV